MKNRCLDGDSNASLSKDDWCRMGQIQKKSISCHLVFFPGGGGGPWKHVSWIVMQKRNVTKNVRSEKWQHSDQKERMGGTHWSLDGSKVCKVDTFYAHQLRTLIYNWSAQLICCELPTYIRAQACFLAIEAHFMNINRLFKQRKQAKQSKRYICVDCGIVYACKDKEPIQMASVKRGLWYSRVQ